MFQDRRKHPRYQVLIKAVAVTERDRFDVVCTDVGPASGFFSCRALLAVGQIVTIEMRQAGLGSPIVELRGQVVRTVASGGTWPTGFAVTWTTARCELGPEPLLKVLKHVLRMPVVPAVDVAADRAAEIDIARVLATTERKTGPAQPTGAHPVVDTPGSRPSSTVVRRVQGSWSPPVLGRTATGAAAPTRSDDPRAAAATQLIGEPGTPLPPQVLHNPRPPSVAARSTANVPQPARSAVAGPTGPTAPSGIRPAGPDAPVHPAPPSGWRPPAFAPSQAMAAEPVSAAVFSDNTPVEPVAAIGERTGVDAAAPGERSVIFDPSQNEPSLRFGRRGDSTTSNAGAELSQSWPVYALAPGERRPSSRHGYGSAISNADDILGSIRPPRSQSGEPGQGGTVADPGASPASVAFGRVSDLTTRDDSIVPHRHYTPEAGRFSGRPVSAVDSIRPISGRHSVVPGTPMPASRPGLAPTSPSSVRDTSNARPATPDPRVMRHADVPVTFLRRNQFVPGRIVGLAAQAVAIVTDDEPPELDEPLTVNMPVLVEGVFRTVYLLGKLLQVAAATEDGKRFVLHIERVDEGKHRGAFKNFLTTLPA